MRLLSLFILLPLVLLCACNRGSRPVQLNEKAPDFTISNGSTTIRLDNYKGKVVMVNFWATWCGPCVMEFPSLQQLHHDMPNVVILAISVDDDASAYQSFLQRHHVDMITARDPKETVPGLFHTDMWPETYIIDRKGYIRRKFIGAQDWSDPEIRNYLRSL